MHAYCRFINREGMALVGLRRSIRDGREMRVDRKSMMIGLYGDVALWVKKMYGFVG